MPAITDTQLWERYWRTRDDADRNRIVTRHYQLVSDVAARLAAKLPRHVHDHDLWSDGALGLMRAVERYDGRSGNTFATYAKVRIRGAMLDGIRSRDHATRGQRQVERMLGEAQEAVAVRGGRGSDDELADEIGVSVEGLRALASNLPAWVEPLVADVITAQTPEVADEAESPTSYNPLPVIRSRIVKMTARKAGPRCLLRRIRALRPA